MKRRVFVGLGNPGVEFADTYHNVGRLALTALAARAAEAVSAGAPKFRRQKGLWEYATIGSTVFVLPLTFMNESGQAVRAALRNLGVGAEALTVLHDDSDLKLGRYKVTTAQRAAGHKGVQSIIDALGTRAFTRVRIGIRPLLESQRRKAGEFVLRRITTQDRRALEQIWAELPLPA